MICFALVVWFTCTVVCGDIKSMKKIYTRKQRIKKIKKMIEKTTTKSTTIPRDLFSWGRYTYNTIIHSSRDLEKKTQQQRRQHLMCADITTTLYRYNSAIKVKHTSAYTEEHMQQTL